MYTLEELRAIARYDISQGQDGRWRAYLGVTLVAMHSTREAVEYEVLAREGYR